jgi:hypothetical protein
MTHIKRDNYFAEYKKNYFNKGCIYFEVPLLPKFLNLSVIPSSKFYPVVHYDIVKENNHMYFCSPYRIKESMLMAVSY